MKLTDIDLEFIKWRIWEPLRRNPDYIAEYESLYDSYGFPRFRLNSEGVEEYFDDEFTEKWKLMYPVHPDLSFDEFLEPKKGETLMQARKRSQGLFSERYTPYDADAAFVLWPRGNKQWIEDKKYLSIAINFERSRNQIVKQKKRFVTSG